jgi:transposase
MTGDGRPLPERMKQQILREIARLEQVMEQLDAIDTERDAMLAAERDRETSVVTMLTNVVGIGAEFAAVLWSEGLFRHFDNRRQVAAYAGLAPTPWQSGSVSREQGVGKSGNGRLRSTLIQLAWLWIRHQPGSELAKWFRARVAQNSGRMKKTMITALARKLFVALWKYATAGIVIEGAAVRK